MGTASSRGSSPSAGAFPVTQTVLSNNTRSTSRYTSRQHQLLSQSSEDGPRPPVPVSPYTHSYGHLQMPLLPQQESSRNPLAPRPVVIRPPPPPRTGNQGIHCLDLQQTSNNVDIRQAKVVKNPVNLHKKTLRLEKDPDDSSLFIVEFMFDAAIPVRITIYYCAVEQTDPQTQVARFVCDASSGDPPSRVQPSGMNQRFRTLKGESLNLHSNSLADWQYKEGTSRCIPIVIELKALPPTAEAPLPGDAAAVAADSPAAAAHHQSQSQVAQSQITLATLAKVPKDGGGGGGVKRGGRDRNRQEWTIMTIAQKIQYGERTFVVHEIFGIDRASSDLNLEDDLTNGRDCVICLSEERTTTVLPCRHMCLCRGCANIMRMSTNKCPICRQTVAGLLQIKVVSEPEKETSTAE